MLDFKMGEMVSNSLFLWHEKGGTCEKINPVKG
jgi:hypothetical protein